MPITHVNARRKTYYLHQGTTKTGKPKYHFAMNSEGQLAKAIPEGFETYENPNARVFLRRIRPKIITDEEKAIVEEGMRKYSDVQDYKIDIKGKAIVIYTCDQNADEFSQLLKGVNPFIGEATVTEFFALSAHYSPMMQFILEDKKERRFAAERYCFMGSIDDWINIGDGPLSKLVKTFVKHLDKESFFELI